MKIKRQGFSIVEALVASAIFALVAFAFIQFLSNAQKGQKNVQQSVEFDMFKTSLNLVFNTKACDGSLKGPTGQPLSFNWATVPTSPTSIVVPTGGLPISEVRQGSTTLAKLNEIVPYNSTSGLKLTKFHIIEATYDGDQIAKSPTTNLDVTYKAFAALIDILAEKPDGSLGAKKLSTKISLRILANPAGNGIIEKCGNPVNQSKPPTVISFATPGSFSWKVPADVNWVKIESWGAGGGGGGGGYNGAGGGGGGGYAMKQIEVSTGNVYSIYIAAGGSGATATATATPGGATTISGSGVAINVGGGYGGYNDNQADGSVDNWAPGGPGGTASGGDLNLAGGTGLPGYGFGGQGGAAPMGGMGGTGGWVSTAPAQGPAPGSGGGACDSPLTDGARGANGEVRITLY